MPEIRKVKHFAASDEPYPIKIGETPYEVSDEELQEETNQAICEEYLSHSVDSVKMPEIWWLLRYFGKKLGFKFEGDLPYERRD